MIVFITNFDLFSHLPKDDLFGTRWNKHCARFQQNHRHTYAYVVRMARVWWSQFMWAQRTMMRSSCLFTVARFFICLACNREQQKAFFHLLACSREQIFFLLLKSVEIAFFHSNNIHTSYINIEKSPIKIARTQSPPHQLNVFQLFMHVHRNIAGFCVSCHQFTSTIKNKVLFGGKYRDWCVWTVGFLLLIQISYQIHETSLTEIHFHWNDPRNSANFLNF